MVLVVETVADGSRLNNGVVGFSEDDAADFDAFGLNAQWQVDTFR